MGIHCPHPFKEGRIALVSGSVDTLQLSAPAGIASPAKSFLAQGHSALEAAHPMAHQDRGIKACIPWGSLRFLCSIPRILIPKVFNKHTEHNMSASQRTQPAPIAL